MKKLIAIVTIVSVLGFSGCFKTPYEPFSREEFYINLGIWAVILVASTVSLAVDSFKSSKLSKEEIKEKMPEIKEFAKEEIENARNLGYSEQATTELVLEKVAKRTRELIESEKATFEANLTSYRALISMSESRTKADEAMFEKLKELYKNEEKAKEELTKIQKAYEEWVQNIKN
ncbi:MAG: hypothetical protein LBG67_01155 [Campylobacteraceae bacterium]|jgi:hypothetical protein|nr:hypothetical protein [Campylobacteraceae bacterium]